MSMITTGTEPPSCLWVGKGEGVSHLTEDFVAKWASR